MQMLYHEYISQHVSIREREAQLLNRFSNKSKLTNTMKKPPVKQEPKISIEKLLILLALVCGFLAVLGLMAWVVITYIVHTN